VRGSGRLGEGGMAWTGTWGWVIVVGIGIGIGTGREGWLMVRVSVCPGCRCRSDEGWVKYVDGKRR
jgi:hypothetical protein